MDEKIMKFFNKHNIHINDIKYIARKDSKTCIYMIDGRVVKTFITVKDFFDILKPYDFLCINKGIVVSKNQIDYIDNCTYHMVDGMVLEGRKRTAAAHKRLNGKLHPHQSSAPSTTNIRTLFSVLDDMPIAFCVIELIFNKNGVGIDFVFRYCNKEMEVLEGKTMDEMMDQSFYKVFPDGDKKWLAAYTDVAINGCHRHLRSFSPEINKELIIKCFCPMENFCACMLMPVDQLEV